MKTLILAASVLFLSAGVMAASNNATVPATQKAATTAAAPKHTAPVKHAVKAPEKTLQQKGHTDTKAAVKAAK